MKNKKRVMITRFISLVVAFGVMTANAQVIEDPVRWSFSKKKIDTVTYEVHLKAKLKEGWHIYSQTTAAGGPVPTSVNFNKNPLLTISGDVKELGRLQKHFEPLFGVEVKQFSDSVDFAQVIKLTKKVKTSIGGTIEYMVCDDEQCLPPKTIKFTVALD